MNILVCIAFHYDPYRLVHLKKVLDTFIETYTEYNIHIIIDTNNDFTHNFVDTYFSNYRDKLHIVVHGNLSHPFHLTWMHRKHMFDNVDRMLKLKLYRYTNVGQIEFRNNNMLIILTVIFILFLYKYRY